MQLIATVLPFLSLASTLMASPVASPSTTAATNPAPAGNFQITSFSDGGIRYSEHAVITFIVSNPATGLYANCTASNQAQPPVATTPFPTACNVTGVDFGLSTAGANFYLIISHTYGETNDLGATGLGSIINTKSLPGQQYNYLDVPSSFLVPFSRAVTVPPV
ncbi:hypothetical protein TWF694_003466 [Orbilia ellipsospora]|uniref:Uncharacterized protein n=1 Tax=Orbilia ellipsospora TaxID=2528407 RepID=A0AAV9WY95_9PEZI